MIGSSWIERFPAIRKHLDGAYLAQALQTFLTNGVIAATGMATGILSARLLGAAGRGELAAIQNWALFFASIAMVGIPEAVIYVGAKRTDRLGSVAVSALALLAVPCGVAFAIGWMAIPHLLSSQPQGIVFGARVYLLYIFLCALTAIPVSLIRILQKVALWNWMRLVNPVVWLLILLYAYWRGISSPLTLAMLVLGSLAGISAVVVAVTAIRLPRPLNLDTSLWRPMVGFGAPILLSTLPQYLNGRLDQLLMTSLVQPAILGNYVVAVSWSGAVGLLSTAFSNVLFPRVSLAQGNAEKQAMVKKALRLSALGSLAMVLPLMAVTPVVIPFLYGHEFDSAIMPAQVLLVAAIFLGLNGVLEEGLKGMGETRAVLVAEVVGTIITVGMLAALLRPFGAMGAALASFVSYFGTTALLLFWLRRKCAR